MSDIVDRWLRSNKKAFVDGQALRPRESPFLKGTALVTSRGQANVYFLHNGGRWILKKFLEGRKPDLTYIRAISKVLPKGHPGFESGTQRSVLESSCLSNTGYCHKELAQWLDETVLMLCVNGFDWAFWADKLREGKNQFTKEQRLLLCKNLSEHIKVLEGNSISHRDLSSTNIMIDAQTWQVHLIDWDSLYRASLKMPGNTTFGTNGYISPIVKRNGSEDPNTTWRIGSDRFSLAVLNVEFLAMSNASPLTGDGGMFEQNELYNRGGGGIKRVLTKVQSDFPDATSLFMQALQAKKFEDCPSPDDWIRFSGLGSKFEAPKLDDLYDPIKDLATFIQKWKPITPKSVEPLDQAMPPVDWSSITIRTHPPAQPERQSPSLDDMPPLDWS
ncbi:MAG: serine/threonine protein kinase [Caldilineaceae bacterium]|nr:serine/threonine protein kinase [Caldilineaceae bacterium]MBP8107541.1 serine/threonine protein kinase [Caldilineaceae bacterium]MBP8122481.1 serine/threonine protein kinase [Caldilineaceae bacterium]